MNFNICLLLFVLQIMAPSNATPLEGVVNDYELICNLTIGDSIPVLKYKSKKTGIHIIIAQVEGPLVNGYFTFATEAADDDGLPHTLEHLVFLGSEDYPYKGVLDLLANRCLASGTNAWTDTDHTAYTVQTAGQEGFLNLLPIYMDHLLYPTLTDAGFLTEVYHITGEAEDAGVVYSEMQSRENTDSSLTFLELQRELYPEPSGYRFETGGIMKNLRDSINNTKIRKYHSEFYRPENLHMVIAGQVEPEEIFKALSPFEQKILSKPKKSEFVRPWSQKVPALTTSIDRQLLYPSDSEDTGFVRIGWRGPSSVSSVKEMFTLDVLMEYLTSLSTSPLPQAFVEVEDPLASEVYSYLIQNSVSCTYLTFSGVPTDKIDSIRPLLYDTLTNLTSGVLKFELKVMKDIINNMILKEKSRLETSPHDTVADKVIGDALYGNSCNDLNARLNKRKLFEEILEHSEEYWLELVKKYLLDSPSVTIRGVPSIEEADRLRKEQESRVAMRKQDLGETGLKQLEDNVTEAKEINEIAPPTEMLQSVPVPGIENINFHPIDAFHNVHHFESVVPNSKNNSKFNIKDIPVKFQLDDIHSNFIQLVSILDTSNVENSRRPYLPLLLNLFLESPMIVNNELIPHEDVIKQLSADTLSSSTMMGLTLSNSENYFMCGGYCNNAAINFKLDMSNYKKGVEWMKRVLFNVKLDADRIKVKANKLLNSIGELKRSGMKMLLLMYNDITFTKDSNMNQINFLRQEKFLKCTIERLEREPQSIIKEIKEVLDEITKPDHITIHMATNVEKLAKHGDPSVYWNNFLPESLKTESFRLNTISESEMRSVAEPGVTGYLTGVGSVESGYILQSTPCITQYIHWDMPALLTAIQYLTQLEGPMWKEIRGKGLAYNYRLQLNAREGTLGLYLTRAAQPAEAYLEAVKILTNHINGSRPWENDLLESARSSLIYEVIEREAQVSDVLQQSLLAYFKKVPHCYNRDLLSRISDVSMEDVKRVALKYFTPLIDPLTSNTVVVCHPSKAKEVLESLNKSVGHNLEMVEDITSSRFSHW